MNTERPLLDVLVIEDSAADARLIGEALRRSDQPYTLTVLDTCHAALSYLNREGEYAEAPHPGLILLDWYLPDEGKMLLHYVKTQPEFKRIPVVVFTGSTNPQDLVEIYDLQANSCLYKSADLDTFLGSLRELVHYWGQLVTRPPHSQPDDRSVIPR